MAKGEVKFFNAMKNYGFINGDDGEDYFVHGSAVEGVISDGDRVEFTATESDKGPRAEDVTKVEGEAAPAAQPAEDAAADEEEEDSSLAALD